MGYPTILYKFGVQIEGFIVVVVVGGGGGGGVCVCVCVCVFVCVCVCLGWVEGAFALWCSFWMLREGI